MRTLSSLDVMGKNTAEKWFQSNTRVFHKVDEEEEDVPQPEKAQESRGRGREEDKEVGRNDLKRRRCGGAEASEKSEAKWTTSDAVKKRPDHNGNVEEKKRRRVELIREKEHFAMNETDRKILWALSRGADIAEIFSPERVSQVCQKFGLTPGDALDFRTGRDLRRPEHRQRAMTLIHETKPALIIGSPPCTMFSALQNLRNNIRSTVEWELYRQKYAQAVEYIEFCVAVGAWVRLFA